MILNMIPWAVLVYSISNYAYMAVLNRENAYLALGWMVFMIIYICFPFSILCNSVVKVNFEGRRSMLLKEKYEDIAVNFIDDYDRANPVTTNEGWEWISELLERKKIISEIEFQRFKNTNHNTLDQRLLSIHSYAVNRKSMDKLYEKVDTSNDYKKRFREKRQISVELRRIKTIMANNIQRLNFSFINEDNQVMPISDEFPLRPEIRLVYSVSQEIFKGDHLDGENKTRRPISIELEKNTKVSEIYENNDFLYPNAADSYNKYH